MAELRPQAVVWTCKRASGSDQGDAAATRTDKELGTMNSSRLLPRALAGLGALLAGLGLVFWVAANWPDLGRGSKFVLLQALAVVPALAVFALAPRHPVRAPLGLLAFLAIGSLFAFFGQTYQTGADPWQLFVLWAALGVPLVLALRHDIVWMPWIVVVMTGLSLWVHARVGRSWQIRPDDVVVHLAAWVAAAVVTAAMLPRFRPWTRAGTSALLLAVVLLLVMVTATGLAALFGSALWGTASGGLAPQYVMALLFTAGIAYALSTRRHFDLPALSFAALAVDTLVMAGVVRAAVSSRSGDAFSTVLLIGLTATGLLAATVVMLMRLARERVAPLAHEGPAPLAHEGAAPLVHEDAAPLVHEDAMPVGAPQPAAARESEAAPSRPWPVVLITAVGAWVATVPFVALVAMIFGQWIFRSGAGAVVIGLLFAATAVTVLRTQGLALFVEQVLVPVLISGLVLMGFGLFNLLPEAAAAAVLAVLVLAVAALIDTAWLRVLLGMSAAGLAAAALAMAAGHGHRAASWPLVWHVLLAVWLLAQWSLRLGPGRVDKRAVLPPRAARMLDAVGDGWIVLTLLGFVHASGSTFLLGPALGLPAGTIAHAAGPGLSWGLVVSPLLALAAMALAAKQWKELRHIHYALPAAVAVTLAAFLPMLGATLLVGVVAGRHGRRGIPVLAALAGLWIIGSFYYLLAWPLVMKAIVMAAGGLALAGAAWLLLRRGGEPRAAVSASTPTVSAGAAQVTRWGALVAAVLTVVAAQVAIHEKESLIANGRPVFVALAPVDPRSLMQGDFMALAPALPSFDADSLDNRKRLVVARIDARGVARVGRVLNHGESATLAADELLIEIMPKQGQWFIASDAWFFREGEGARWARARFAEYRVTPEGRALLVNVRGANLEAL
jgi:uncharacterized membrane-anchored protein